MSLESGPEVEGEDDRDSLNSEPEPMTVGHSSLPTITPLAFNDTRLVRQPEAPLARVPPQPSPADLPAQPSAAILSDSHVRKGSDITAMCTPAVNAAAYHHDSDDSRTARSSLTSSTLPPSYHTRYSYPMGSQNSLSAPLDRPMATDRGEYLVGERIEETGMGRPRRSLDGRVRLAGGPPGEGNAGASGSEEGSIMPPSYHDL
ncbi:hypothetical protein LXA43DRAFT_1002664 [Ganoderma leucocontextum]|nr:hypothetical protein LXA43DRAFT_1002664 [Ganoderma leucocontextum]